MLVNSPRTVFCKAGKTRGAVLEIIQYEVYCFSWSCNAACLGENPFESRCDANLKVLACVKVGYRHAFVARDYSQADDDLVHDAPLQARWKPMVHDAPLHAKWKVCCCEQANLEETLCNGIGQFSVHEGWLRKNNVTFPEPSAIDLSVIATFRLRPQSKPTVFGEELQISTKKQTLFTQMKLRYTPGQHLLWPLKLK